MEDYDEFIAEAMEKEWIEPVFGDDEITMKINPSEDNPLWQVHLQSVDEDVAKLIEIGAVEVAGVNEQGDIVYRATKYGHQLME